MNNNEPIVLGTVKKGKTGKPLVVLLVFLIIGSILLFLPSIINYFGDYNVIDLITNGEIIDFIKNHNDYVNKVNQPIVETTTKKVNINEPVLINPKTVLSYNNFTLRNFDLKVDSISFDANTKNTINFDKSNYYLVLSKNNKDFIYKLVGEITKSGNIAINFKSKLEDTIEVKGIIKEIKSVDYPSITLNTDESGLGTITCDYENNKIEYTFMNNDLISIKDTYNYIDKNDGKYFKEYTKYTNISNNLNNIGATSSIIENTEGFIIETTIDLNTYQYDKNTNSNYYSLNTKAKIVHFEMNAKGYDCK